MIFALDPGGGPITAGKISFDGPSAFARAGKDWELALKGSGTLRFLVSPGLVDVWILDAGEPGASGSVSGGYVYSGKGGDGGLHRLHTLRLRPGVDYAVTIGESVKDNAPAALSSLIGGGESLDASAGTRSSGGTRAQMAQGVESSGTVNTGGADGVWPFEDASQSSLLEELLALGKLAAAGAAGDANNNKYVYTDQHGSDTDGGDDGGGDGGTRSHRAGHEGTGYGAGAGGGYGDGANPANCGAGALGAPGLILMRPHKEVTAA